jgi:tRNA A37 threonylcarbamoyltransferase TsaD
LKEEEERWRSNDESTSPKASFSHSALHASANNDDGENETKDMEEDEIRQLCAHLNNEDTIVLMKLLKRMGERSKLLLMLGRLSSRLRKALRGWLKNMRS